MKKTEVGIIGQGFVGKALKFGFEKYYTTNTFDIKEYCNCESIGELISSSDKVYSNHPTGCGQTAFT